LKCASKSIIWILKLVKKALGFYNLPKKKVMGLGIVNWLQTQMGVVAPSEIETPKAFKHFVFLGKKNP
jgi:hypothetical protein